MDKFEEQKLAYEKEIDKPIAAFDVNPVVVTGGGEIVLVRRIPSVQDGGKWSMPGGKVFVGERIETTLRRITYLKTGLDIDLMFPVLNDNLVGVDDNPIRDPRGHVVGITFLCQMVGGTMIASGNSDAVKAFSPEEIDDLDLAFGHDIVLSDALEMLRYEGKI